MDLTNELLVHTVALVGHVGCSGLRALYRSHCLLVDCLGFITPFQGFTAAMAIDDSAPFNIKRIRYSATKSFVLAFLPSMIVCLIYHMLFDYRRDYLGHYAAGYGGTLCAIAAFYGAIPAKRFVSWAPALLMLCVILCIAGGTVTEATVFRLAKFDEGDYCNQNLGAVLAGLVAIEPLGRDKPGDATLRGWVAVGGFFLALGGYFAVT